jgi:hypothetical protein
LQSRAANRLFVVVRHAAERCVDYQSDLALLNMVDDVRAVPR